jgi:hypothetical protein
MYSNGSVVSSALLDELLGHLWLSAHQKSIEKSVKMSIFLRATFWWTNSFDRGDLKRIIGVKHKITTLAE